MPSYIHIRLRMPHPSTLMSHWNVYEVESGIIMLIIVKCRIWEWKMSDPEATHPLDQLVPDPSGRSPVCGEEQFATVLRSMVAVNTPKVFAVVEEFGERVDARIAAWGLDFGGRAEVVTVDFGTRMGLSSADDALLVFRGGHRTRPRFVWYDPNAIEPDVS